MPDLTPRKKCYEELMDLFKEAASEWLKAIPEARGLMLVVDWECGQNDFPACSVVSKEMTEKSTLDSMKQGVKLLSHLSSMFNQQINKADSVLAKVKAIADQQSNSSA